MLTVQDVSKQNVRFCCERYTKSGYLMPEASEQSCREQTYQSRFASFSLIFLAAGDVKHRSSIFSNPWHYRAQIPHTASCRMSRWPNLSITACWHAENGTFNFAFPHLPIYIYNSILFAFMFQSSGSVPNVSGHHLSTLKVPQHSEFHIWEKEVLFLLYSGD